MQHLDDHVGAELETIRVYTCIAPSSFCLPSSLTLWNIRIWVGPRPKMKAVFYLAQAVAFCTGTIQGHQIHQIKYNPRGPSRSRFVASPASPAQSVAPQSQSLPLPNAARVTPRSPRASGPHVASCHPSYEEFTRLAETRLARNMFNYLEIA